LAVVDGHSRLVGRPGDRGRRGDYAGEPPLVDDVDELEDEGLGD
jgi:hypothetical protein